MRGIDHHGAEEPRVDAVVAGLLVAVVEMDGEDGLGENLSGGPDDRLQHALSVYLRAPLEIWMMNGACDWMQP